MSNAQRQYETHVVTPVGLPKIGAHVVCADVLQDTHRGVKHDSCVAALFSPPF